MLPDLENPKIEIRPFVPPTNPARTLPIDPCCHWKRSAMVRWASVAARDKVGDYEAVPVIFVLARIGRSVGVVVRLSLVGGTEPLFRGTYPTNAPIDFEGRRTTQEDF